MSESSGLGYGLFRSSFYIIGISLLLLVIVFEIIVSGTQNSCVTKDIIRFLWILVIVIFVRIIIDLLTYGYLDLVGVFPFIEFIISSIIFARVNVYKWINSKIDKIKYFAIIMMLADIVGWGYSIISNVSFGVFRANISGIELNRMADLFYAGVASFILIDKDSKILYRTIALFTILVTLYRSAYLASIAVFIYYFYFNHNIVSISKTAMRFLFFIIFSLLVITGIGSLLFEEFSLIDVLFERFLSTFLSEGNVYGEASKSQRFDQIEPLFYAFLENVILGAGFGFYLLEEPIYNYFNYVLIALVIAGLPLIAGLFIPVTYLVRKIFFIRFVKTNSSTFFINSMAVYFFVLINAFPYMIYFPIASVFAFTICYHLWSRHEL